MRFGGTLYTEAIYGIIQRQRGEQATLHRLRYIHAGHGRVFTFLFLLRWHFFLSRHPGACFFVFRQKNVV